MGLPQEVVNEVFQVIEGGAQLGTPAEIIQFPTDNGQSVYNVVQKTYQGTNGTGFNYWVVAFETLVGGVATAVSGGAALLTMEIGASIAAPVAAIGAALGLTTGYVLYNLSPEFWNKLSADLVNAGETIGGKLITFINENGVMTFSENAIEIIKNNLLDYGAFDENIVTVDIENPPAGLNLVGLTLPLTLTPRYQVELIDSGTTYKFSYTNNLSDVKMAGFTQLVIESTQSYGNTQIVMASEMPFDYTDSVNTQPAILVNYLDKNFYIWPHNNSIWGGFHHLDDITGNYNIKTESIVDWKSVAYIMLYGETTETGDGGLQQGATAPDENPFPQSFPNWLPWEFPIIDPEGTPQQIPDRYPVEFPDLLPDPEPYQDPAQNPDPATQDNPDEVVKILEDPNNDPSREPHTEPEPEPDPDPQPEPDPLPEDVDPNTDPDPTDPNRPPTPSIPIVVPSLPATVASGKLFTVYNPTQSQLDALGGYLWDGSIIAAIRDIWQEPLDGVISLLQVYATPTTSGSHNIILGFLDSGVSAAVVSNQFVTVDCGSVTIPENKQNATDYAPYTSLHLYLPFIGIVELDTNECMSSTISVKYKIDVYTGTCLATVSVDRDADMPNDPILYTYSGNCSQQIPLTSGNATGMLSALIGGITAGLSVASGGGLGVLAGAQIAGQSLTHEMFHISHSGNISANAGIMGIKKPYLIIGRRHNYDANNYNKFYGFPVNKTVILGNHTGYVEVKKGFIKTSATKPEHDEIMQLLQDGVIL